MAAAAEPRRTVAVSTASGELELELVLDGPEKGCVRVLALLHGFDEQELRKLFREATRAFERSA